MRPIGVRCSSPRALLARAIAIGAFVAVVGGCAPGRLGGRVSITSQTANPVRLDSSFTHGGYAMEPGGVALVLSSVPLEALKGGSVESAQAISIHYLWEPWAGRTPVSDEATNLMIRHVVIAGDEIGVYGGGGFGWPGGTPGETNFSIDIARSNVSLLDATPGFRDLLTPAVLRGNVVVALDAEDTIRLRDAISQYVTDRLGRSRWVAAPAEVGPARVASR